MVTSSNKQLRTRRKTCFREWGLPEIADSSDDLAWKLLREQVSRDGQPSKTMMSVLVKRSSVVPRDPYEISEVFTMPTCGTSLDPILTGLKSNTRSCTYNKRQDLLTMDHLTAIHTQIGK